MRGGTGLQGKCPSCGRLIKLARVYNEKGATRNHRPPASMLSDPTITLTFGRRTECRGGLYVRVVR